MESLMIRLHARDIEGSSTIHSDQMNKSAEPFVPDLSVSRRYTSPLPTGSNDSQPIRYRGDGSKVSFPEGSMKFLRVIRRDNPFALLFFGIDADM
jgi:hypothetical protein